MKTFLVILLLCGGPAEAQVQPPFSGGTDRVFQKADSLFGRGDGQAALELVRQAARGTEARYWELAAMGRLALASGPREGAAYADRIREGALAILDRDPDHAGAHHALGVVYREVMSLSRFARVVGRTFLGGEALSEASWPMAERHLNAAVSLDPDALLFRLDLARLHLERGNPGRARSLLQEVTAARPAAPPEEVFQNEARELLRGIP